MALGNLHVELQLIADQYFAGMKNAQREATTLSNSFRPLTKTLSDFGNGMKSVGIGLTASITAPLVAIGTVAVKTGIDFESAFADVRKSVQATEPEFASLRNELRQMAKEIPISAVELASVADAAGQLGIKTENIAEFTRTMAKMGATTNLSSTAAAEAMARFDNITGRTQKNFDRMGSTLVTLGANLAATESEIISMAQNMGAAGHQIGLTQAQILGIAGALSSVGLEAERGGTAFYRVMIKMQDAVKSGGKDLKIFSAVAGVDFKKAFEDDAANAINLFIAGLAKAHLSGQNLTPILKALELGEIRVSDALRRTGNAYELVSGAVAMATDAYAKNASLQREFSERLKTTEAKLIVLKNALQDVGITLFDSLRPIIHQTILPLLTKLVGAIADAANKFSQLPQPVQTATVALLALGASIGPAAVGLAFAVNQISALIPVAVRLASILSGGAGVTVAMKSVAAASTMTAGEMALFGRSAAYVGTQTTTAAAGIKGVAAASATAGTNTAAAAGGAATLAGSLSKVGIAGVAAKAGIFGLIAAAAAVSTAFLKAHFDAIGYEASLVRAHDSGVRLNHALRNIDFKTWGGEIKSALSDMTGGLEKFTPAWLRLILNMPGQIDAARKSLKDFLPDWLKFLSSEQGPTLGDWVHYGMGFARMDQISAGLEMLGKNPGVPGGLKVAGAGQAGSKVQGPIDPFASMDPEARKAFAQWPEAKKDLLKQIAGMEAGTDQSADIAKALAESAAKQKKSELDRYNESVLALMQSITDTTPPAKELVDAIHKLDAAGKLDSKAILNLAQHYDTLKNSTDPVIQQIVRMIPLLQLHAKTAELEADQLNLVAEATKNWAQKSENLDFSFLQKPDITMPDFEPLEPGDLLQAEAVTRVGELNDQMKALKATVPAVERQVRLLRIENKSDAEIMALLGGEMESAARIAKQFNVPLGELTRTIIMQQDRVNNLRYAWSETFASISDRLVDMVVDFDFSFKKLSDFAKDTAKSLARSFLDGFFKPFRDGLAGLGESLAGALSGLLTKGSGGGGIGGILGGLLGGGKGGGLLGKIPGVGGILAGGATTAVAGASMLAPEIAGLAAIAGSVGPGSAAATAAGLGGGAAAGGGGLMAAIGGLATNPITIAAAGALGVGLLIKKFTGQGRETADIFGEAVQKPFGTTGDQYFEGLQDIIDPITKAREAGTLTAKMVLDAQAALEKDWKTFGEISQSFIDAKAGVGGKEQIVVDQAFETLNPIIEDIRASLQADLARLSGNQALVNGSAGTGGVTVNNPTINVYAPTGDGQDIAQQIWNIMHNNWAGTAEETARRVFALEPAVVSR